MAGAQELIERDPVTGHGRVVDLDVERDPDCTYELRPVTPGAPGGGAVIEPTLGLPEEPQELPEPMLTISEVADYLSVGRSTVERWIASGALRSVLIGQRVRRIPRSALAELLRNAWDVPSGSSR